MKRSYTLLLALIVASIQIIAQSPEAFQYQAVARDAGGEVLDNQNVGVEFQLHQTTPGGTVVYTETHSPITNDHGLFSVEVGNGTPSVGTLAGVDWSAGPYFLEVGLDPAGGSSYASMGTQQLLSVPYALYAKNVENGAIGDRIEDSDADTKIETERNPDNDTIFFSTAGSDRWAMTGRQLFPMNSHSTTFLGIQAGANDLLNSHFNTFVGFHAGKTNTIGTWNSAFGALALEFNDQGINNSAFGRSALNFNVNGNGNSAFGTNALLFNTTGGGNTAIGNSSMRNNSDGLANVAVGSTALYSNISGDGNTVVGFNALVTNRAGNNATAVGYEAMQYSNNDLVEFENYNSAFGYQALMGPSNAGGNTGNYNTAVGYQSLRQTSTGSENTGLGYFALRYNESGSGNTAVGTSALLGNNIGQDNTAIGASALSNNPNSTSNVAIGFLTMGYATGSNNTAIGREAGRNGSGDGNVFIGYTAGFNESGSNTLYIENSDSSTPLIYGNFADDSVKVFGSLSVGDHYTLPTADGTSGQVISTDGSGNLSWAANSASIAREYAVYQDQSVNGSNGGNQAAQIWGTRTLNTTIAEAGSSISRSGDTLILAPGTYKIDISAPAFNARWHAIKLYNHTDGIDEIFGTSEFASNTSSVQTRSTINAIIVVTSGTKKFLIQHFIYDSSTHNLGAITQAVAGNPSIYTNVFVERY